MDQKYNMMESSDSQSSLSEAEDEIGNNMPKAFTYFRKSTFEKTM